MEELIFNQEVDFEIDGIFCRYFFFDTLKPLLITFAPAGDLVSLAEMGLRNKEI